MGYSKEKARLNVEYFNIKTGLSLRLHPHREIEALLSAVAYFKFPSTVICLTPPWLISILITHFFSGSLSCTALRSLIRFSYTSSDNWNASFSVFYLKYPGF